MSNHRGFLDEPEAEPPQTTSRVEDAERGWVAGIRGDEGPIQHPAPVALPSKQTRDAIQPLTVAALALVALIVIIALLELGNFAVTQFAKAEWLGWLTVALVGPLVCALGWSAVSEFRGYTSLRAVDRIRSGLSGDDIHVARKHAHDWLYAIGASAETIRGMDTAPDADKLRALLRSGPLADLDQLSMQAGRDAAMQVLAATAISPWPGLDGVLVIWRGLRLIRRVAALYGLRPGTVGTLRLWRRLAADAGSVAAADVAVAAMTEALFNSPVGGALAGQATGSAIAARRMLRLAVAIARSCHPIDEPTT